MIGIIGFGRFGRLMARYLARDFEVQVYNRTDRTPEIEALGARPASLASVCQQPYVLVSVAISAMQATFERIAPLLQENAVVVDVASVKLKPVAWMEASLPPSVSILATHPMFGPDSAAKTLEGSKIVLCPRRIEPQRLAKIKRYLTGQGLIVIETSPEEHDRQIAVSLCLTHFIGRALAAFGAEPLQVDTEGYRRLLHILGVVENDTWQLFEDMHRQNPFAPQYRAAFLEILQDLHHRLS